MHGHGSAARLTWKARRSSLPSKHHPNDQSPQNASYSLCAHLASIRTRAFDHGRQHLAMPSTAGTRASPLWHHLLSRLSQARTHVTLPTATDVCLPFGMQFAAPHMLCTPNAGQRLLTRLEACWNGWCVRRAGSDLNPNLLLVFTANIAVESFAIMSPTFRSA